MNYLLVGAVAISVLSVSTCTCLLLLDARALVKAQFGVAQREGTKTRDLIDRQANGIRSDLTGQLNGIRRQALGALNQQSALIRRDIADGLGQLNHTVSIAVTQAVEPIQGIRADLGPVLANAAALTVASTRLVDNYAALPAQLSTELRPSWLAIQPEITCRQLDGSGYGGCWHSRITGLMGEAVNVGGTFTKHFPSLVSSFDGIGVDTHKFTTKFTAPTSTRTKIWEGFRGVGAIASHF